MPARLRKIVVPISISHGPARSGGAASGAAEVVVAGSVDVVIGAAVVTGAS